MISAHMLHDALLIHLMKANKDKIHIPLMHTFTKFVQYNKKSR